MHTRFLVSLFALVLFGGTVGYLLSQEDVSIRTEKQVTKRVDPLKQEKWKQDRWRRLVSNMGVPEKLRGIVLDKAKARQTQRETRRYV